MAGWAGFTDEDLRRMKQGSSGETATQRQAQLKRQRAPNRDRLAAGVKTQSGSLQASSHKPLDPSQRLSLPEEPKVKANGTRSGGLAQKRENLAALHDSKDGNSGQDKDKMSSVKDKPDTGQEAKSPQEEKEKEATRELDEKEALEVEMGNMVKFQQQQKIIEEANKQKREYLTKAISERKKKAKAESEKLGKIQKELSRLDTLLSVDVRVIRDKIEAASLDYMDAQRRYARAEQEFINAKMALFEKGELKERLTEHLYTIIHQNEVRKANKLAELMKQLEMEVAQDEIEVGVPSIPILTNFNSVTTLHNPAHKSPVSSPEAGKTVDPINKDSVGNAADQKAQSVEEKSEETNNNTKEQSGVDNSGNKKSEVPNDSSKKDSPVNECLSPRSESSVSPSQESSSSGQEKVESTAKSETSDSTSNVERISHGTDNSSVKPEHGEGGT